LDAKRQHAQILAVSTQPISMPAISDGCIQIISHLAMRVMAMRAGRNQGVSGVQERN